MFNDSNSELEWKSLLLKKKNKMGVTTIGISSGIYYNISNISYCKRERVIINNYKLWIIIVILLDSERNE